MTDEAKTPETPEEVTEEVTEAAAEVAEEVADAPAEAAAEVTEEVAEAPAEAAAEVTEEVAEAPAEAAAEVTEEVAEAPAEPEQTMDDISDKVDESFTTFKDEDAPNWEKLDEYRKEKTVLTVTVNGVVNKGVVAHLENVRGFIPASHLALEHVDDLNEYLGKEIQVQVLEVEEAKNRLLLSRRALLRREADEEKKALVANVPVDSVLDGTVDAIKDFGAFVKLENDLSGLVHVSQISRNRVKHPADVLKVGQKVKVKVIAIKDGKLSLSMKALEPGGERRGDFSRDDREPREKIDLPTTEALSTNLGDLLKGVEL